MGGTFNIALAPNRVVVMEDDALVRELLQVVLKKGGYQVVLAGNGIEGMQAMRNHGADLVITDLFMPEQDGLQTIMQLRKEFPAVRIVAMTSGAAYLSLSNARETATLLGADGFLEKPLNQTMLLDMMEDLLGTPRTA
ncbi:response regulator [Desulfovibrio subterraneus]|jgi:CheY-like chemotaxis protein|uniref:Response regulator n=1 Tax=Desulfovibrio subterraneus TaxID=2718620 RepID=A0A7J0BEJ7_9BACT|nr:response regulator [Desulfovibrio subterraneus]WBF68903.1 response regulator [Desulfovibrio subterraneus]GFM32107.1 response regulator [Desulfovibrio subterraneus]